MLIEIAGWRLLTDPTFDPPGGAYRFGWGTGSEKLAGPALAAGDLGRSTPCCSATTTTTTTSTPRAGRCSSAGTVVTTPAGAAPAGGRRPGLAPWEHDDARSGRASAARGHGDALPPRPAAQPSACRRRDRLRAGAGRASATARSGSPATPSLRRRPEVADRLDVDGVLTSAASGSRSPARSLHDDRQRGRRAVRSRAARDRHPDPLRGLEHFREGRAAAEQEFAGRGRRPAPTWLELGQRGPRSRSDRAAPTGRRTIRAQCRDSWSSVTSSSSATRRRPTFPS